MGGGDPKVMGPLNPACRDASFGTVQSPIGHTVMELLTVVQNSEERTDEQTDEGMQI